MSDILVSLESLPEYQMVVSKSRLLQSHYDEIALRGNISRNQAKEIVTIAGESFLQGIPINSFTEIASKLNCPAAMEGLLSNIGHYTWEAVKIAVKFLIDLLKEVSEMILKRLGLRRDAKKMATSAKVLGDFSKNVGSMGLTVPDSHPRVSIEISRLEDIERQYRDSYTTLTHDLLGDGVYGKILSQIELLTKENIETVILQCKLFDSVIQELNNSDSYIQTHRIAILDSLKAVIKPMNVLPLPNLLHRTPFRFNGISNESSFFEIVKAVGEHYADARVSPYSDHAIDLEVAVRLMSEERLVLNSPKTFGDQQMAKEITTCGQILSNIQQHLSHRAYDDDINEALSEAWRATRENISAVAMCKKMSEGLLVEADRVGGLLLTWSLQKSKVAKIKAEIADPNNRDDIQREVDKLHGLM